MNELMLTGEQQFQMVHIIEHYGAVRAVSLDGKTAIYPNHWQEIRILLDAVHRLGEEDGPYARALLHKIKTLEGAYDAAALEVAA